MAPDSNPCVSQKASWDETNVAIFLQILVEEIDAGNRPSGHFTKTTWSSITTKFVNTSGCNFSLSQLKNKWDNMKKEFALWEKLLHEETGLGFDHATSRIVADPIWWRQKLQEKPEFCKFKTHGPLHLDLQERVFRGVVATGYMEYYPGDDAFLGDGGRNDEVGRGDAAASHNEQNDDTASSDDPDPNIIQPTPNNMPNVQRVAKRKRTKSQSTRATVGDVNRHMVDVLNVIRDESASSIRQRELGADEYSKSIQTLRALPWIDTMSQQFATLIVLLEDPTKRVAFSNIMDLGEEVIENWIEAWKHRF